MTLPFLAWAGFALASAQEPGNLRWPVGPGSEPCPLRATYGQLEGRFDAGNHSGGLHLGLDVLYRDPEAAYETVKAIEAGTVVRVRRRSIDYSAVVVASRRVKDRAFLYLHLDRNSILVEVGDEVKAGDPLGRIAYANGDTGEPHLHLSRLGKGFLSHTWSALDELSVANPLKLLKAANLGDSEAPVVVPLPAGASLAVRANEAGPIPASSSELVSLDVIVQAYDQDPLSAHRLAPYELELSVTTAGVTQVVSRLTLDGKLGSACDAVYNIEDPLASWGDTKLDKYLYYFVITNGGSPPTRLNAWAASPGDHVLHATVRDVKGNSTTVDQAVHVP